MPAARAVRAALKDAEVPRLVPRAAPAPARLEQGAFASRLAPLIAAHSPPRSQIGFALAKQGAGIQKVQESRALRAGPRWSLYSSRPKVGPVCGDQRSDSGRLPPALTTIRSPRIARTAPRR